MSFKKFDDCYVIDSRISDIVLFLGHSGATISFLRNIIPFLYKLWHLVLQNQHMVIQNKMYQHQLLPIQNMDSTQWHYRFHKIQWSHLYKNIHFGLEQNTVDNYNSRRTVGNCSLDHIQHRRHLDRPSGMMSLFIRFFCWKLLFSS